MAMGITMQQRKLMLLIQSTVDDFGVPPSYDEMAHSLNLASKSGIHRLVKALEERGYIRRIPNKARAIEVLKRIKPHAIEKNCCPHSGGNI